MAALASTARRYRNPHWLHSPQHAVDFIIDTLRREPEGTVTLCTLGALTNVATALQKAPDIAPRVRELVLMGGGFFEGGNITPAAEFNIYVDPHAAEIVFRSGIPLVMMPLDVTHKLLTTKARVARIRNIGTHPAIAMAENAGVLRAIRRGEIRAPTAGRCMIRP